ncbi:MAG: IPT/TIG domain-containing protein [Acidobacteria bacterium]|nr:IPT/TIG domain-containing protein [Acidobacteriota bacterium]
MKSLAHFAVTFVVSFGVTALQPGLGQTSSTPVIFFSDLDGGPNTGGQNNAGTFVTLYGKNFGTSRGSSVVTTGGGQAAAYPLWTDTKLTIQIGAAAATGNITVTTAGGTSNGVPFTVRPGNIYFVATTGNNNNNGSFAAPWQTLLKARDAMQPGDISYALDGVSQLADDGQGWSAAMLLRNGGSPGAPKALVAYPGATVTIGSISGPSYGVRAVDSGSFTGHWTFAGLVLRGRNSAMALAGPSNNIRIIGNDISCPNGNGEVGCFATAKTSFVSFHGNNLHDAGAVNASSHYHGVYWSTDSNHIDMGWNTIANIRGCRGIQTHSSPLLGGGSSDPTGRNLFDLSIHDNLIHDTQCDAIILATVDPSRGRVEVYNNIIYNAGKGPNNPEGTGAWTCVNVPGTTANGTPGGGVVDVYNNTMYNCGSFATPPYGNANAAVENGGNNTSLKIRLRNNILYQPGAAPYLVIYGPADGIQGTNNLFFGNGPAPSNPNLTQSVSNNPLFANLSAFDFHLTASSPAANAGVSLPLARDYDGVPLPQGSGYPIGALALVGSSSTPVVVSVNPGSVGLSAQQSQQFTAAVTGSPNTSVNWSMNPSVGTLSFSGLYTAPASIASQQTVQVMATSVADPTRSAVATITLNPPVNVSVNPASASLNAGQNQQFTAAVTGSTNTAVTWSLSPASGTLSSNGLYTAPASVTSQQTVQVRATSVADPARSAVATITLNPPLAVSVNPATASLIAGQSQQFTAAVTGSSNTAVTWSLSAAAGSLSSTGLYTAPASVTSQQTVQVTATSVADPTRSAVATITLNPPVTVSVNPGAASLATGQSQQFTAAVTGSSNTAVTWSLSAAAGTLSSTGLYTAPASVASQQILQVIATSVADPTRSAAATITLNPPVTVTINPATASLTAGQTQQFTAAVSGSSNTAVTWSLGATAGSLSSTGLYTAPASVTSQQTVQVRATSVADPTRSAVATVTLNPPVTSGGFSVSYTPISATQVRVDWTAPAGQPSSDWIALSGTGSPNWWYVWYRYTGGATSGSAVVNLPPTPGYYEFHYYLKGSYTLKAKSETMPVGVTPFSLTTTTAAAAPGTPLTVRWNVPAGRPSNDSVGLYLVGAPNDQPVWRQYPNGATTGTFTMPAPATPGVYEFRWRIGYLAAARSTPIVVR